MTSPLPNPDDSQHSSSGELDEILKFWFFPIDDDLDDQEKYILTEAKQALAAHIKQVELAGRIDERNQIALDNYRGQTFSESTNWHSKFDKFVSNNEKRLAQLQQRNQRDSSSPA